MKKPKSDTATAAVRAALNARKPPIKPPAHVRLRAGDLPFWRAVIAGRSKDEWAAPDLVLAAHLARCMADIESESKLLETEGLVSGGRVNPRANIVDTLQKRQLAMLRSLRMTGRVAGDARHEAGRRRLDRQAERIAAELDSEDPDGLLAR